MRVTVRKKNLEMTPPLQIYIEQKIIAPMRKLLKGIELSDLPILDIEVERTTRHHRKGRVYRAGANLTLGKILIRAEAEDEDVRAACDGVEGELKREVLVYKERARALLTRRARRAKNDLRLARSAVKPHARREWHEGN